jgi:histidinol phosphatase-like PHP family hydrolase
MRGMPFHVGIQAEGRDWMNVFSRGLLARCDFILADGMTFPNTDGTYSRLWIGTEVKIDDVQFFMDRYTDYLVDIASEPIDIIANLTYLPEKIRDDYDDLWSQRRTMKIIRAAVENDVAIEINSTYRIPRMTFLKRAKAAGAKFAFGANSHNANDTRDIDYCIKAAKELRLTREDMFVPGKAKKITTYK